MKKLCIHFLGFIQLFSASLCFAAENPFLKYTKEELSKVQTFHESGRIITAPKGNKNLTSTAEIEFIPDFTFYTKGRIALFFKNSVLLSQSDAFSDSGRTKITSELVAVRLPEIMKTLKNEGLLTEATRLGKLFGIDPLAILGPVIGEFTFNGFIDQTMQSIFKKLQLEKSRLAKSIDPEVEAVSKHISNASASEEGQKCLNSTISNYWKWRCVIYYSNQSFNNSNADLLVYRNANNSSSSSGKQISSYGLGQIKPILLWSVNDLVHEKVGYEKFNITNLEKPFDLVFNNRQILAYIAAMAYNSIQLYKLFAGVDISQNPGLMTTLYNLGDEYKRAFEFGQLRTTSNDIKVPQVNYMGWYINKYENQIRGYLNN